MFDIGWSELLIIGVVALIAIGPKELPGVLRALGQWMGKIRRMASDFQDQFREAMREAEVADLKRQVDEMTNASSSYTNFDPLETVKDFETFASDKPLSTPQPAGTPEAAPPATDLDKTIASSDTGADSAPPPAFNPDKPGGSP